MVHPEILVILLKKISQHINLTKLSRSKHGKIKAIQYLHYQNKLNQNLIMLPTTKNNLLKV